MSSQQLAIILFLAGQTVLFITTCVTVYVRIIGRLKELEVRVQMMERQENRVLSKLDDITEQLSDLKTAIQNKQDRQ
jgi:chaperonin cofactor prefoldin